MTIETKMNAPAGANGDVRAMTGEMMAAFEALKAANDARLEEIEKRGAPDPLLEAKLKKIEMSLDRQRTALEKLALEQSRPVIGEDTRRNDTEHKSAWGAYLRRGDEAGMHRLDLKSVNVGTESQGGYVAPPELDRLIEQRLMASSPKRQIASVRQTSATVFRKPVSLGAPSAWAGETGARAETTAPLLDVIDFATAERIPAMYELASYVRDGGFMSYGPSPEDGFRQAAVYVDKILKGAKPADLPAEQPTRYYLNLNRATAESLGLQLPQALLVRADEVIQ